MVVLEWLMVISDLVVICWLSFGRLVVVLWWVCGWVSGGFNLGLWVVGGRFRMGLWVAMVTLVVV